MQRSQQSILPPLRPSWNNNFSNNQSSNSESEQVSPTNPKTYKDMSRDVRGHIEKLRKISPIFQKQQAASHSCSNSILTNPTEQTKFFEEHKTFSEIRNEQKLKKVVRKRKRLLYQQVYQQDIPRRSKQTGNRGLRNAAHRSQLAQSVDKRPAPLNLIVGGNFFESENNLVTTLSQDQQSGYGERSIEKGQGLIKTAQKDSELHLPALYSSPSQRCRSNLDISPLKPVTQRQTQRRPISNLRASNRNGRPALSRPRQDPNYQRFLVNRQRVLLSQCNLNERNKEVLSPTLLSQQSQKSLINLQEV